MDKLSQTIALTRKPQLERISRESKSSVLRQLTSMLVSDDYFITHGIDFFKSTIIFSSHMRSKQWPYENWKSTNMKI